MPKISHALNTNVKPDSILMGVVYFLSGRSAKVLHAVIATPEKRRAKDVDNQMNAQIYMGNRVAVLRHENAKKRIKATAAYPDGKSNEDTQI